MGTKRRAVVNADEEQLDAVETLIDEGRYRTLSEFVREAIDEKLERLRQDWLAEEVERYVRAGEAERSADDLVSAQAFDERPPKARSKKRGRAKR